MNRNRLSHRVTAVAAGLVLAPLLSAAAWAQATVLPGYWESTSQLEVLIPEAPKVTRKCLTAAQVQQWITGPSNRHYTCTYDRRDIQGGRVRLGGVCRDRKGRTLDVDITGNYSPVHFHLVANFHFRLTAGVSVPGVATTDARRISADCPASPAPDG